MEIFIFVIGLVLLVIGAQLLISSATNLARWFGISEFIIGLTIVTLGTSLPESMISVTGALYSLSGESVAPLVVGEIIGSNMVLLGIVVGVSTLIRPIKVKHKALIEHGGFAAAAVLLLWVLGRDGHLTRPDGVMLLLLYLLYIVLITRMKHPPKKLNQGKKPNIILSLILIIGSCFSLIVGTHWVLEYGTRLATSLGVSSTLIGLFLIGPSTSLPELVVNISAALRKKTELSLGNILGSIIYSVAIALGAGVTLGEFHVPRELINIDMPFFILTTFILLLFFYSREKLQRSEGFLLVGLYIAYALMKVLLST